MTDEPATRPYERVYTMTDYYDGPRRGIADFDGRPHLYEARFEDAVGYTDTFELREIDAETLALALEDWAIWLRWDEAFHAGRTTVDTHPALPGDRVRYVEVAPMLDARLALLGGPIVVAFGTFRTRAGHADGGRGRFLEVQWIPEQV